MPDDSIIASDRGNPAPPSRGGLYYHWGPQAWIDMWMSNTMLVKKAMPIISHTFVPILRLSGDKAEVDRDYAAIKSRRETIRWYDSPREKWRKRYGNFVREAEWALLELRRYYSPAQFEDIVVGTAVALSEETSAGFIDYMRRGTEKNRRKKPQPGQAPASTQPGRWATFLFTTFNPAHWLTGPATLAEVDLASGLIRLEIPDCGWHSCGPAERLPRPDALPEEGCLYICKAPFEAIFNGQDGGPKMLFEPHLPETSCTVRMSWSTD